jgi:hypothetical protein
VAGNLIVMKDARHGDAQAARSVEFERAIGARRGRRRFDVAGPEKATR